MRPSQPGFVLGLDVGWLVASFVAWLLWSSLRDQKALDGVLRGFSDDFILSSEHPGYEHANYVAMQTGLPPGWVAELYDKGYRGDKLVGASTVVAHELETRLKSMKSFSPHALQALKGELLARF